MDHIRALVNDDDGHAAPMSRLGLAGRICNPDVDAVDVAENGSGPRRQRFQSIRDLLMRASSRRFSSFVCRGEAHDGANARVEGRHNDPATIRGLGRADVPGRHLAAEQRPAARRDDRDADEPEPSN
jgi:hypothetical protein